PPDPIDPTLAVLRLDSPEVFDLQMSTMTMLQRPGFTPTQRSNEIVLAFRVSCVPLAYVETLDRAAARFARVPTPITPRMIPPLAMRSTRRRRERQHERLLRPDTHQADFSHPTYSRPVPPSTPLAECGLRALTRDCPTTPAAGVNQQPRLLAVKGTNFTLATTTSHEIDLRNCTLAP